MNTPTLDKHQLHPFGGYCTCFSHPLRRCDICQRISKQRERWDALLPEELLAARREYDSAYQSSSNQDGR